MFVTHVHHTCSSHMFVTYVHLFWDPNFKSDLRKGKLDDMVGSMELMWTEKLMRAVHKYHSVQTDMNYRSQSRTS